MKLAIVVLAVAPLGAAAQTAMERAALERDRQSAEFSRPQLRDFHVQRDQQHLPARPDERVLEARERDAVPPPEKPVRAPDYAPLPLPGGPRHGVDPIPVQGAGG